MQHLRMLVERARQMSSAHLFEFALLAGLYRASRLSATSLGPLWGVGAGCASVCVPSSAPGPAQTAVCLTRSSLDSADETARPTRACASAEPRLSLVHCETPRSEDTAVLCALVFPFSDIRVSDSVAPWVCCTAPSTLAPTLHLLSGCCV
eukprot:4101107-Prymnesium_polylepis.1